MTTAKAAIVGLLVTAGLLASTLAIEGIAQLLGPEEVEVHDDEVDDEVLDIE